MLSFRKTNFEKTYGQVEGWTDGQIDGQTLFYKTLPAKAGDPVKVLLLFGLLQG